MANADSPQKGKEAEGAEAELGEASQVLEAEGAEVELSEASQVFGPSPSPRNE
jgi:hypothetical protein